MLSKIVTALISPLGTALSLGMLACLLGFFGRRRSAALLGLAALVWLFAWSTPAVSLWARAKIESDYPLIPVREVPAAQAIVVLGGGMAPAGGKHLLPDLGASADRVWHAARLYRAGKAPLLLLSGGSEPGLGLTSEAQAMRVLLLDLGVPDAALLLEEDSRTTEQNTRLSVALLRQRGVKKILLVTSALHMKRALVHWQDQGLQVVPVAADHEARPLPGWQMWIPDARALASSAQAIKEWVGSLAMAR